jgi:hypothetical protein
MFLAMLARMGTRVSQATNPNWFEPAELAPEAVTEKLKLGRAMLSSSCYADASMLAQAELNKWPEYRYTPRDHGATS